MSAEYSNGLCNCGGDCKNCCCVICCPCYVQGKISEKVGESCVICGILSLLPIADCICRAVIRQKVREQKGIAGNLCGDLMVAWCCFPCSLCQDMQEVNALDMAQSISRE